MINNRFNVVYHLLCVVILWVGLKIYIFIYKNKTMSKEMREHIDNFKNFLIKENSEKNVTEIIKKELKKWEDDYNIKTCDINTGDCFVFAESLENILKGLGFENVEVLTTDLFYDLATEYAKEDEEIWYKEEDYNSFKPKGFQWVKNGYHGWIYVNGKHYDAEEVNGVRNFYDLPIFKRHTY